MRERDTRNLFIGDIGGQNLTAPICIINAPESAFSVLQERERESSRDSNLFFLLQAARERERETRERRKRQGHTRAHIQATLTYECAALVDAQCHCALVVKFRSHTKTYSAHIHKKRETLFRVENANLATTS